MYISPTIYMSPSEISEKSGVDYKTTMKVLRVLEEKKLIRSILTVQCECANIIGDYEDINDVPVEYECSNCGEKKQVDLGKVFLLFKKV